MTIQERLAGDVTLLDVNGRITVQEGATEFGQTIARLLNRARPQIVVNMAAVPYIDSTALGELARGYSIAARRGGALKLLNLSAPVGQLLTMTRLADVFETFDAEADAVKSFR